MNKLAVKKLFWKIVNEIEVCCDTVIENDKGVVAEKGMGLSNGYSVTFNLDDGIIRLYDSKNKVIDAYSEDNETLLVLKDLFEALEL